MRINVSRHIWALQRKVDTAKVPCSRFMQCTHALQASTYIIYIYCIKSNKHRKGSAYVSFQDGHARTVAFGRLAPHVQLWRHRHGMRLRWGFIAYKATCMGVICKRHESGTQTSRERHANGRYVCGLRHSRTYNGAAACDIDGCGVESGVGGVSAAAAVRTCVYTWVSSCKHCPLRLGDAAAAAVAAAALLVSRVDMQGQSLFRATGPACPCAAVTSFPPSGHGMQWVVVVVIELPDAACGAAFCG